MKTAIVYASVHHGNTKKIVDEIANAYEVELVDATQVKEKELSGYDVIGFASYKSIMENFIGQCLILHLRICQRIRRYF